MSQVSYGSITITDATDGVQSAIVYLYRNSDEGTDAAPSVPSNELTYTFSTGRLSGTLNGWQQSTSGLDTSKTIWLITAMALSSDTTDKIKSTEWSQPRPFSQTAGQDGKDGLNQATVFIYKRGTDINTPIGGQTYNFENPKQFKPPNGWHTTIPASNINKDPCYVSAAAVFSRNTITEIQEWAEPTILVQDGEDGEDGAPGTSYYTHIRYATDNNGANMSDSPAGKTYIGIYTGTSELAPTTPSSYAPWSEYVGHQGDPGTSVTGTKPVYFLTTSQVSSPPALVNGTQINETNPVAGVWTTAIPTYIVGEKYYTSVQTTFNGGTTPKYSPIVLNQGLTDSNYNAALAKSIAQSSEENSIGALSIARGVRQHFFWFPTDVSDKVPAGSYMAEENEEAFKAGPTKGNLLTRSDGIWIRDGAKTLAALQGDALTFFVPDGNLQGKPGIQLTNSALNFYRPGTTTIDATLNSNGLVLTKGGVKTTNPNTNNFVYLSSESYGTTYNINGSSNVSDWKEIIGTKFGVRADGTLYANGAVITGKIEASSGSNILTSVSSKVQYNLSSSTSTANGTWSDTVPTWSNNKYIWTRVATTKTTPDGSTTTYSTAVYDSALTSALSTATSAQSLANGAASTVTTTTEYNLSSSTSTANGTWSTTVPTWSNNKYIWTRLKIVKKTVEGTTTTSYTPSEAGSYDSALTTALSTAAEAKTTAGNAAPKSSAIAEEQRIYYRSNSNTKPNGNGLPTAWVTETGNKYNTNATTAAGWSRKITPISTGTSDTTKYLYLWTCIQRKTVSGTITYGDILLDDSTTVIDGGKIITGSIDANKINVTDLKAFSATIGGWNISDGSLYRYADSSGNAVAAAAAKYYVYIQSKAGNNGGNYAFALRTRTDAEVTANSPAISSATVQFGVSWNGSVYAKNATIEGKIQATSGFIGQNTSNGFTIANTAIYNPTTKSSLNSDTIDGVYIGKDGIALGQGKFKVTNAGALTATSGKIGKYTITGTYLYTGSGSTQAGIGGDQAFWAGSSTSNSAPFRVSYAGALVSTSADIKGKITATSGSFDSVSATNFTLTSGSIANSVTIGGTAASTVLSDISTAQSTANTAKTNAATAQSTANTAKTNAATAQSTANTAKTNAATAQSTADTANTNATNAAKTATSYITDIDSNAGITIKAINSTTDTNTTTGNYIKLNTSGLDIYNKGVSVALYGSSARIGKSSTRHIEISSGGLKVYQDSSTPMAHIGYASGNAESGTAITPYFVFGKLDGTPTLGNYSVTEGYNSLASGPYSHAEGYATQATRFSSHAEGYLTKADGWASHASGFGTIAHAPVQMAIGQYNVQNGSPQVGGKDYLYFIIGNGEDEDHRSNAFTVDGYGNVNLASGAVYKVNGQTAAFDRSLLCATGSSTTSLAKSTVTQIPLTTVTVNKGSGEFSTLGCSSNRISIKGTGYCTYRITGSIYISPAATAWANVFIRIGAGTFANATEIASAVGYMSTTGGAINVTKTIEITDSDTYYVYLGARVQGTTGTAHNNNCASYLEVEQIYQAGI